MPPGASHTPFRNRWWHFYERGLAWADAGDDARAEADFRQCLRLRLTDSRLARTYGMHFVQCFAHRELGAVLLRQGDRDGAERELLLSLSQEPSAKAEHLLEQARAQRAVAAPAIVPAPATISATNRIELASIVPVAAAPGRLHINGHLAMEKGAVLWAEPAAGPPVRIAAMSDGSFSGEFPSGTVLSVGSATGPDRDTATALIVTQPEAAPKLTLDGPDEGMVVRDGCAWYRWQAEAAGGLQTLLVEDDSGQILARLPLAGQHTAGTLRLDVPSGRHVLRFILTSTDGQPSTCERTVASQPAPTQDRSLRAIALAIPLQTPRPGAMRPGDDPRLLSALLADGRFRLVDQRADALLARELALVEAGYVDRTTAAEAGRRLACRYVIAGTMTRGERDAECFLRLVHCASGRVVASADAYAELPASAEAEPLFTAVAGRLRQIFPVVAGSARQGADGLIHFDLGPASGVKALMRIHLFPAPPGEGPPQTPTAEAEVVEVRGQDTAATLTTGNIGTTGWGVSE